MSTISWRLITRTHPHADIFRAAVLAPDSNFKFNKVGIWWDSINCNSLFPEKMDIGNYIVQTQIFPKSLKVRKLLTIRHLTRIKIKPSSFGRTTVPLNFTKST